MLKVAIIDSGIDWDILKNNEVIDSFVGEKNSKDVEEFLKKNLNIE